MTPEFSTSPDLQEQFDTGPLSWVMPDIRESMTQAGKMLKDALTQDTESQSTTLLHAKNYLHQAHGALQIVDIDGVSIVTETIEELTERLQSGQLELNAAHVEVIIDAFHAVLRYLEDLLSGAPHQPVRLFPYYRALLELKGAERIHPADLFFPSLSARGRIPELTVSHPVPVQSYAGLRQRFEKLLLTVLTGKTAEQQSQAASGMQDILQEIDQAQTSSQAKAFWVVMRAFVEAVAGGHIAWQQNVKQILGRINLQIRRLVEGAGTIPERLLRDALFYLAQVDHPAGLAASIREAYQLNNMVPPDYEEKNYGQIAAGVLATAKEQLTAVKNLWGRIANGDQGLADKFAQKMKDLADTGAGLNSPALSKLLRELSGIARHVAYSEEGNKLGLELATSLLFVENALDQITRLPAHFAERAEEITGRLLSAVSGDELQSQAAWMGEISREAQQRQTMAVLVTEMQTSLRQVEKTLDEYFREPASTDTLHPVDGVLHQIGGALAILDQDAAMQAVEHTRSTIAAFGKMSDAAQLAAAHHQVAQNIGALSFFIETLQTQPDIARKKFAFDQDAGLFRSNLLEAPAHKELLPVAEEFALDLSDAGMQASAPLTAEQELAHQQQESARLAASLVQRPDDQELQTQLKHSLESERSVAALLDDGEAAGRARAAIELLNNADAPQVAEDLQHLVTTLPEASAPVSAPVADIPHNDEEVDAELLEIFLTEADEVLTFVQDTLPHSRQDPENQEYLTALRRSFHTLKGSSRMVGLTVFGEAAWNVEQVMNLWLAESRKGSEDLYALLERAAMEMVIWVEELRQSSHSNRTGAAIIAGAQRLKAGLSMEEAVTPEISVSQTSEPAPTHAAPEPAHTASEAHVAAVAEPVSAYIETLTAEAPATEPDTDLPVSEALTATAITAAAEHDALMPELDLHSLLQHAPESSAPAHAEEHAFGLPAAEAGNELHLHVEPVEPAEAIEAIDFVDATLEAQAIPALPGDTDFADEAALPESALHLHEDVLTVPMEDIVVPALPETAREEQVLTDIAPEAESAAHAGHTAHAELAEHAAFAESAEPTASTHAAELTESVEAQPPTEPAHTDSILNVPVALEAQAPASSGAQIIEFPDLTKPATTPDDNIKRIGDLEISLPLYSIYMAETDEIVRFLTQDFSEWRHEPERPVTTQAIHATHTLAGSSATVGLKPLQELAHSMELVLQRLERHPVALQSGEYDVLEQALETAKRMLQKFALSELAQPAPEQIQRLEHLLEAVIARSDAGADEEFITSTNEKLELADLTGHAGQAAGQVAEQAPAALAPETAAASAETQIRDEIDQDLLPVFIEEGSDLLPMVGQLLRSWQEQPQDNAIPQSIARLMHTIKGSARMAGAMRLGQHIHDMETRIESLMHAGSIARQPLLEDLVNRHDHSMLMFEWLLHPEMAAPEMVADAPISAAQELDQFQEAMVAQAAPVAAAAVPATPAEFAVSATSATSTPPQAGTSVTASAPVVAPALNTVVAAPAPATAASLVRVRADVLDRLVNQAGEVSISRSRLENEVGTLRASLSELTENVNRLRDQLREVEIQAETQISAKMSHSADREFDPLEFDRFTRLQELTRMMAESVSDVAAVQSNLTRTIDGASTNLQNQARLTRDLQQDLMRVRMIPFASVSERLYRVTRQTAKEVDKRVNLDIRGSGVEMDRGVLEKMVGPFEHLLRNAIVHGIENRSQRQSDGKAETGELLVEVRQEGNEVVISFSDDGRGLDLQGIRQKAQNIGLIAMDAQPTEQETAALVFEPGFTTASEVTELAGRGVGMDVVRSEAASLGGRVEVATEAGKGARFTIHLPLTLAVTQVVLLNSGGKTYAVPSVLVEQVQHLKANSLANAYNDGAMIWQGQRVPVHYLSALLGLHDAVPVVQQYTPLLIMKSGADRVMLHVDDIVGNREVVVKNIGPQLARMTGIAGATVLGSGEIVLILNPVQLALRLEHEHAHARLPQAAHEALPEMGAVADLPAATNDGGQTEPVQGLRRQPIVMVVDDSLTVRRVTQRLLTREGYQVVLAKDGIDALEQLQSVTPDIMLVDIEMPRMDGFDLTRNVRGDARTGRIPIIMITSRTADKHRNYAKELGVNEYFGKPYREDDLLGAITHFVGQEHVLPV